MSSLHLPSGTDRPKRTEHLIVFERALESLNDLYWGARAGFSVLQRLAAQDDGALDTLPSDVRARWNVPAADVPRRLEVEGSLLRHVCIVQAVTIYEDYIRAIVESALRLQALPAKKLRLEIDLSALPEGRTVEEFVKDLWIAHKTREVLDARYDQRPSNIEKALGIDIDDTEPTLSIDRVAVGGACVVRNGIVHAAGRVDARLLQEAGPVVPGMVLGEALVLEEPVFWRLLGALRGHAMAIDLLTRIKYCQLAGR